MQYAFTFQKIDRLLKGSNRLGFDQTNYERNQCNELNIMKLTTGHAICQKQDDKGSIT